MTPLQQRHQLGQTDELARIKQARETVESIKKQLAELSGRRDQIMESLTSEFHVNSIEQATEKAKALDADISELSSELEDTLTELDEKLSNA